MKSVGNAGQTGGRGGGNQLTCTPRAFSSSSSLETTWRTISSSSMPPEAMMFSARKPISVRARTWVRKRSPVEMGSTSYFFTSLLDNVPLPNHNRCSIQYGLIKRITPDDEKIYG